MKEGHRILAVVPARGGSKGIRDKNMQVVGGHSLIARAARCLKTPACQQIDRKIISTDVQAYADEAIRHGLEAPFLRPAEWASDTAGAVETMQHAWHAAEAHYQETYDILLIVEPTCPLRLPEDISGTLDLLIAGKAESVVTVSKVDSKFNPAKILALREGRLDFYLPQGAQVKTRQSLENYFYRNGACYAVTRRALLEQNRIFTENTLPLMVDRPLVNIDEPEDLALARWLVERQGIS
jgi:CMP-N,N'-diacetyllegionaminic acid synthase